MDVREGDAVVNALVAEYDSQAGPRRPVASRMASAGVFPFAAPGDLDAAGIGPAAVITELRDSVHAIGALGLCRDELEAALGALSQLRAAVDACEAQFAAEIDRLGDFGDDAAGVLRSQSGCSRAAAKRAAGRAQALARMPNVAEALSQGRTTAEHADVLVGIAGIAGAGTVDSCAQLLDTAAGSGVERTRRVADEWIREHRLGMSPAELHRRQRAQRRLTIARTADGMIKATALMDPAIGAAFRAVIDDVAQRFSQVDQRDPRPDAVEPRSYAQCRLDALVALVGLDAYRASRRCLDEEEDRLWPELRDLWGTQPRAPLAREHLAHLPADIAVPEREGDCACGATSPDRRFDAPNAPRRRNQVVIVADVKAVEGDEWARCEIAGTGPIPLRELERLACGADIFGVIFDGDGQPLWHGRRVRTVTDAQWRALVARDRHCVVCEAAPNWCEAHHLVPWRAPHRGSTNIDNLALLCTRCHHELHDSGLALRRGRRNSCTLVADLMRE